MESGVTVKVVPIACWRGAAPRYLCGYIIIHTVYNYLDAAALINSDPQRVAGGGTGQFWYI